MKKLLVTISVLMLLLACSKNGTNPGTGTGGGGNTGPRLSYGDTLFYVGGLDDLIAPVNSFTGKFRTYPLGLALDSLTGVIDLSKSETGLRYAVLFFPADNSKTDTTYLTVSGITYHDRIYRLSQNERYAYPVYNARTVNPLPSGDYAKKEEVVIDAATGRIDLGATKTKLFQSSTKSDYREVEIRYECNDLSNRSTQKMKAVIYYYDRLDSIPPNVIDVMKAHQRAVFGQNTATFPQTTLAAPDFSVLQYVSLDKPRPPCIIIVGN